MAKKRKLKIATFLVLGMVTGRLGTFSQSSFASNPGAGESVGIQPAIIIPEAPVAAVVIPSEAINAGGAIIPPPAVPQPVVNIPAPGPAPAPVLPTGGHVVGGEANINLAPNAPNHLIINQSSDRAIIEWETFNIGVKEITEFKVPNSSSISLNRVVGGTPSEILGTLKSNGHVWLINPNGVLFSKEVTLDVGGLLVTGSNIANDHFMNNPAHKYDFTTWADGRGNDTSIIYDGHTKFKDSGMVILVAPYVRNNGTIEAKVGKIYTSSGTTFTVDPYGDGLINYQVSTQETYGPAKSMFGQPPLKDAVRNSGKLIAEGGKVVMTTQNAKRVVENVINMDGVIKADSAVVKNGEVYLYGAGKGPVKVTGKINDGVGIEKGGKVTITSDDKVIFAGKANINASGNLGGGEIFIGGDFQGLGKTPQARITFVGKEVKINANAKVKGDGGTIVAWSKTHDGKTGINKMPIQKDAVEKFVPETIEIKEDNLKLITTPEVRDGITFARGSFSVEGAGGGKGGMVETSGFYVETNGIQISAVGGTWLVDPFNVEIAFANNNGSFALVGGVQVWTPGGGVGLSSINAPDINAFLDAGTSVIINTTHPTLDAGEAGNIRVLGPVTKAAGAACSLTLNAVNDIDIRTNINGNVVGSPLTLVLDAGNLIFTDFFPGFGDVNVAALSAGALGFNVGRAPGSSLVDGSPTGTNIVALRTVASGTFLFNGNPLPQFISVPSPTPTNPPSSATNPSDSGLPPTNPPPSSPPGDNVITVEPSPPPPAPPAEPPPAPPSAEPPPAPPPEAPPAPTPEPSPTPTPEAPTAESGPPLGGPGGEDFPSGGGGIGGTPEGREAPTTVEGAGGKEGVAEGAFNPENINKAEEVPSQCPMNVERFKGAIPPDCPEKSKGPVRPSDIAGLGLGDKNAPIGPDGVNGVDVPVGAAGIRLVGEELDGSQREAVALAEGREVIKGEWSQEDINRAPEYREQVAPLGFKEKVSFWSKIKTALIKVKKELKSGS